jgi:hypothetical protein
MEQGGSMPKSKKPEKQVSVSTNTNSLFNPPKIENTGQHCTQNVNVAVNIDQKDDCLVGCFKAIASVFKRGG